MNIKPTLNVLINATAHIRDAIDPEMPVQQLLVLLMVAKEPGITMKDLGQRARISQASMSRNVDELGMINRHRKPGKGVMIAEEDPMNRRQKLLRLTPKGMRAVEKLCEIATPKGVIV
jgi:DNA-binding MarR family transcriptional regulator